MEHTSDVSIDHQFVPTNGVRLHVAQAGAPDAPLVILLHGFPEFWYGWRDQIPFLAEHGYRVWCPDQRGYNLSDKPKGIDAYRIDTLGRDIIGLMDAAGQEQVCLVGHDWGGGVAWALALNHPERLKKLAIMNTLHPTVFRDALRHNRRQRRKSWYFGAMQIPALPEMLLTMGDARVATQLLLRSGRPGTLSDAEIAEYVRAWKQPGAMTAMINWYRAAAQRPYSIPKDTRVRVPTLVLWGAQDVALEADMAQKSIEMCEDGRLVMFDNATHWVQHDEPQQVNALLGEFLR
jgi:pimeloyl-ACP methyl ester carboxylesterase